MLRTITIGSSISVQGVLLRQNQDGTLVVGYGGQTFTGHPVPPHAALSLSQAERNSAQVS